MIKCNLQNSNIPITNDTNLPKSVRKKIYMNPSQNPSAIRSKNEITDALLQLMKTFPYNEITVKQIILESHVARKTFYRNFLSKDDVLDAYIDRIMYQYIGSLQQMKGCRLSNTLDIIFSFCIQYQNILFLLRDNNLMHLLLRKWNTFIPMIHNQIVDEDCSMFQTFSPEETSYIIAFNIGAVWNIIMKWLENDMIEKPDNIKKILIKYLTDLAHSI